MKVKLIGHTQAVEDNASLLDQIAYVARVSNPGNQSNTETSERLVRYLIKNRHWSPFEMVDVTLEITTTREIVRQILRHRSFVFQEFSQRYADPTKDLKFETKEMRLQDTKNRQNSIESDDHALADKWEAMQLTILEGSVEAYKWAVDNGLAKEVARAVLPEGMTESKIYMKGAIRSWIHYIELRSGNGTQKEHRVVAQACADAIQPIFPMIMDFVGVLNK